MTVVETYVREKLCIIRQQEEDLETISSQVNIVCSHIAKALKQDDARVILAVIGLDFQNQRIFSNVFVFVQAPEIQKMLSTVDAQQKHFGDVDNEHALPDSSIPITFTKDNRVHIGAKIEMRVVTLGLDGSGKTSLLFKLKQDEFVPTIPTIGFNVETLEYKNIKLTVWDVGGSSKLRPLWKHYYLNTQV